MGSELEHGRVVEPRGLSRAFSRRSLDLARDFRGVAADRAAGLAAGKRGAFHTADVQAVAFAGVDIDPAAESVGAGGAGTAVGVHDLAPVERAVGVHDLGPQRAELLRGLRGRGHRRLVRVVLGRAAKRSGARDAVILNGTQRRKASKTEKRTEAHGRTRGIITHSPAHRLRPCRKLEVLRLRSAKPPLRSG